MNAEFDIKQLFGVSVKPNRSCVDNQKRGCR